MNSTKTYQIGWFSTGRDKAARDLLTAVHNSIQQGEIKADFAFVFCSREPGESRESNLFIKMVGQYGIPLVCFSYQKFRVSIGATTEQAANLPSWRLDYDREVMKRLEGYSPDLCVLAGYILVVGREMCQRYDMINLHPAAPGGPTGTWQEVIRQLIDNEAKTTGVMMHLVTPELDRGPVVAYCTFSIRGEPFDKYWLELKKQPPNSPKWQQAREALFNLIRQHGLAREFPLIIATIKAFSQSKIEIRDKKVVDAEGRLLHGYDLTGEVDEKVAVV
ncbi:MAG: phosphoglycerate transporter [Chloroflexi bacterium]|nr:phosphoglycerate transporter [Chloroflexota bacterium]